jgi:hypothetical protein
MNEALVLLVLVWAGLLVPGVLRSRNASPHATVGGFERAMDVLRSDARGTKGGRQVLVPRDAGRIVERPGMVGDAGRGPHRSRGAGPVVARRLIWFLRCLVASVVTFVVAVVAGGWFWLPFVVSAGLTTVYVAVLRHLKLQRDEARRVVSDLDLYIDVAAAEQDIAAGAEDWVGSGTVRLRRWND